MSCATSITCYFFYVGFINLIFLNIKLLSSEFYFNGIGLVYVVTIIIYSLNSLF
jgi:hypothetical protein